MGIQTVPVIAKGSKLGMHIIYPQLGIPLLRWAVDRGIVVPLVKAVNNAGVALDTKKYSPGTLTIVRFKNDAWDAANGVEKDDFPVVQAAKGTVQLIFDRTNADERAATDYFEVLNEADPPGVLGWSNFALFMQVVIAEANARSVRLALPAFNAGTPEWDEMLAMVGLGLFRDLQAGGHILTIHEGALGANDPVSIGFGATIPGAPVVEGAGSMCFRYRYLYSLLAPEQRPPLVVSEFYAGGGYAFKQDAAQVIERFAWYDAGVRQDDFVLAFCPFTIDPDGNWLHQDYTYAYGDALNYMEGIKDEPNGAALPPPDQPPVVEPPPVEEPPVPVVHHDLPPRNNWWVGQLFLTALGSEAERERVMMLCTWKLPSEQETSLLSILDGLLAGVTYSVAAYPTLESLPIPDLDKAKLIQTHEDWNW